MAYSIVAACVMLLRYEIEDPDSDKPYHDNRPNGLSKIFNTTNQITPTRYTSGLVTILVTIYALLCVWMALIISKMAGKIAGGDALAIVLLSLPIIGIILTITIIVQQPKSSTELTFSVPFCPYFPALSIMINIYLMVELDILTWIRFAVWIAVGLLIYFFYGRRYSKENERHLLNSSIDASIDKIN